MSRTSRTARQSGTLRDKRDITGHMSRMSRTEGGREESEGGRGEDKTLPVEKRIETGEAAHQAAGADEEHNPNGSAAGREELVGSSGPVDIDAVFEGEESDP